MTPESTDPKDLQEKLEKARQLITDAFGQMEDDEGPCEGVQLLMRIASSPIYQLTKDRVHMSLSMMTPILSLALFAQGVPGGMTAGTLGALLIVNEMFMAIAAGEPTPGSHKPEATKAVELLEQLGKDGYRGHQIMTVIGAMILNVLHANAHGILDGEIGREPLEE